MYLITGYGVGYGAIGGTSPLVGQMSSSSQMQQHLLLLYQQMMVNNQENADRLRRLEHTLEQLVTPSGQHVKVTADFSEVFNVSGSSLRSV